MDTDGPRPGQPKKPVRRGAEGGGNGQECACLCHKGGVVLHVVACCGGAVLGPAKPMKHSKPDDDTDH